MKHWPLSLRPWDLISLSAAWSLAAPWPATLRGSVAVISLFALALAGNRGALRLHVWPLVACSVALCSAALAGWPPSRLLAGLTAAAATAATAALEMAAPSNFELPTTHGRLVPIATSAAVEHTVSGAALVVRAYYPSSADDVTAAGAKRAPYLSHGEKTSAGFAALMKLPSAVFAWVAAQPGPFMIAADRSKASTAKEAAPTPSSVPAVAASPASPLSVAVFLHGLGGVPEVYSAIIADLVSRGWLVLAPEFCDGSAAYAVPPRGPPRPYTSAPAAVHGDLGALYRLRAAQLRQRVEEAAATLDLAEWLAGIKSSNSGALAPTPSALALRALLAGKVDATRLVLVGHSFGAATALSLAARDARVRAVVALDTWAFPLAPEVLRSGVRAGTPVLSLCGEGFTAWRANARVLKLLLSPGHRAPHIAPDDAAFSAARERWERPPPDDHGSGKSSSNTAAKGAAAPTRGNGVAADGELLPHFACAPASHANPRNLLLTLRGAAHQNFSDAAHSYGRVIRWLGLTGPVDPALATRAVREATHAFLSRHASGVANSAPPVDDELNGLGLHDDVRAVLCSRAWVLGGEEPPPRVLKNP